MCLCKNVDFGTYDNIVAMLPPAKSNMKMYNDAAHEGKPISIDVCIATEIAYLWQKGITTLNSCCGHNKVVPSVIVTEISCKKMLDMGYEQALDDKTLAVPKQTFYLKGI